MEKGHVHGANCKHDKPAKPQEHVHSANCSHGKAAAAAAAAAAAPPAHVHSANCSHGQKAAPQEHVHSANCSHGKKAVAAAPPQHKHGAGCSHGHGHDHGHGGHGHGEEKVVEEEETQGHHAHDPLMPVFGGALPECRTPEERGAAVEAMPVRSVGELVGKTRELWRLGKLLFEEKSYTKSLHLFAESTRLGCRWIMTNEGARYWGETVYNVFHGLPDVDKLELAVFASWSHWWIIQTCLTALQQQAQQLPRDELTKRLAVMRTLQKNFEQLLEPVASDPMNANRPQLVAVLWVALSVQYSSLRRLEDDLRCAKNAVKSDPGSAEAQVRCGCAMLEAKDEKGAEGCFSKAVTLLPDGALELMTAHLGAAYCKLATQPEDAFKHVRQLRALDLEYSAAAHLRFDVIAKDLMVFWPEVAKAVAKEVAKGGVCSWCLKPNADKKCSACNVSEYCSMECFKSAWKGDQMFPPHKQTCKKK